MDSHSTGAVSDLVRVPNTGALFSFVFCHVDRLDGGVQMNDPLAG